MQVPFGLATFVCADLYAGESSRTENGNAMFLLSFCGFAVSHDISYSRVVDDFLDPLLILVETAHTE